MRKFILSLTLLLGFIQNGSAKDCVVYGITDSPQKLDCSFSKLSDLKLRCYDGLYYLNGAKVHTAFHMEVERGPVPLVFQTRKGSLTVEIYSNHHILGTYQEERVRYSGKCR